VTLLGLYGAPIAIRRQRNCAPLAPLVMPVMATSDHNMTGSENSENSSEPTLKKQTVQISDLIQADKDMEKVNRKINVLYMY